MCRLNVAVRNPSLFYTMLHLSSREGNIHGTGICMFDEDEKENRTWYLKDKSASPEFLGVEDIKDFQGDLLWGHTRLASSTYRVGNSFATKEGAHPHCKNGITVMHNGMFTDYLKVSREQEVKSSLDSEVFLQVLANLVKKDVLKLKHIRDALEIMGPAEYSLLIGESREKNLYIVRGNRMLFCAKLSDGSMLINTSRDNITDALQLGKILNSPNLPEVESIDLIPPWTVRRISFPSMEITEIGVPEFEEFAKPKPVVYNKNNGYVWKGGTKTETPKNKAEPQQSLFPDSKLATEVETAMEHAEELYYFWKRFPEITLVDFIALCEGVWGLSPMSPYVQLDLAEVRNIFVKIKDSIPNVESIINTWLLFEATAIRKGEGPRTLANKLCPDFQIPIWMNDSDTFDMLEDWVEKNYEENYRADKDEKPAD